jgi:hypothetical protein
MATKTITQKTWNEWKTVQKPTKTRGLIKQDPDTLNYWEWNGGLKRVNMKQVFPSKLDGGMLGLEEIIPVFI